MYQHNLDPTVDSLKRPALPCPHAGLKQPSLLEVGSTASTAFVLPDRIITANVGDSMTILCRNGSPVPISIQHRVWGVGDGIAEETARVEAAGACVAMCSAHSVAHQISRSVLLQFALSYRPVRLSSERITLAVQSKGLGSSAQCFYPCGKRG